MRNRRLAALQEMESADGHGDRFMHVKRNFRMLDQAKELRRRMTTQERKLWYDYLQKYPAKVYKQRIIESFIADFYCASARLVIEIDGSQHYTAQGKAYDQERSLIMQRYGIDTIRFTNSDIDHNFHAVCAAIDDEIQKRLAKNSLSHGLCRASSTLEDEPGRRANT